MASIPGMPFDCGIVRGASSSAPLVVRFHPFGGDFVQSSGGAGIPGEWSVSLDDALPNGRNTFWYGYHPAYDITAAANVPPSTGSIVDYTARRVDWTLDWALREFPLDTSRVYTYGYSMGAMGATELAFRSPRRIAGVMSVIGQFDFSFVNDPEASCSFNPGGSLRALADQIWGTVSAGLPAPDGAPVYEHLNGRNATAAPAPGDLPPILAFNGRKDLTVGWAEKVAFWRSMQEHRRGGLFFWDNRDHGVVDVAWAPMQVPSYLDRFRNNRSFPALSQCDLDSDLGDGTPASGDSVGTMNAFVEWDVPDDEPEQWSVTLTLRGLTRTSGAVAAPESALVDVTPRRVQRFAIAPLADVPYRIVREADEGVLGQGTVQADSAGSVTVPGVRVHLGGTRLELGSPALAGLEPAPAARSLRLRCALLVRGDVLAPVVSWPRADASRLELVDVSGRRVATLFAGQAPAGDSRYEWRATRIGPGVYFLRARSGREQVVRRVVVLQ
jgi:pimeloyl-ACP methyl ester carboxylesterase